VRVIWDWVYWYSSFIWVYYKISGLENDKKKKPKCFERNLWLYHFFSQQIPHRVLWDWNQTSVIICQLPTSEMAWPSSVNNCVWKKLVREIKIFITVHSPVLPNNSYDNIEQIFMKCVIDLHISFVPWWTTQGSTVYEHFNFRCI